MSRCSLVGQSGLHASGRRRRRRPGGRCRRRGSCRVARTGYRAAAGPSGSGPAGRSPGGPSTRTKPTSERSSSAARSYPRRLVTLDRRRSERREPDLGGVGDAVPREHPAGVPGPPGVVLEGDHLVAGRARGRPAITTVDTPLPPPTATAGRPRRAGPRVRRAGFADAVHSPRGGMPDRIGTIEKRLTMSQLLGVVVAPCAGARR